MSDPKAHETTYEYDDMGRFISTTSPDTGTVTHVYDEAGNPVSKTDAKGITLNYTYDLLNRLTAVHFPDPNQDITYTYDERTNGKGHLTGMTDPSGSTTFDYDNRGQLSEKTSIINGNDFPLTYGYSPGNRLTSVTYPTGRTVTYTRNSTGKVEEVSTLYDSVNTILMTNLSYLPFGPVGSIDMGAGSAVNNVFDELYRMIVANPGAQTERTYTYDGIGNITNIQGNNNLTKPGNNQTDTYTYIPETNKLQEITGSNPTTFTHDANGNITGKGNMTLTYNQNNRLIRAEENGSTLGEYTYNGLGQRVMKQAGGVTTLFFYDFNGNLVGESLSDGTVSSEYIYMGNSRLAKVDSINNVIYYYCNDHLGTPQLMTDENGVVVWEATYKPFGEAQVNPNSSIVNNFRFPGQYFDQETGLHYNYFRDYHPLIGRYVEPDTIGLEGGINLYVYALNNPINLTDPNGQFGIPGIIIGAASGAFGGWAAGMKSGHVWAGVAGGAVGGLTGGLIGFMFPQASSVVGGMIGGAVAGALGGSFGGGVGKRLSDPDASNTEMALAIAKGFGIGMVTGGTAGGLGTAAMGAGASKVAADLAGEMATLPVAMCLGIISFDSALDTEDDIDSTIPDSIKYTPNIYTSNDTVDRDNYVNVWVDSDGKACPPYNWSVSGTGFHFNSASGPTTATTNADLETLQLWADSTACGSATITVIDDCEAVDIGYVRCTEGRWVDTGNNLICDPVSNTHVPSGGTPEYEWDYCEVISGKSRTVYNVCFSSPGYGTCRNLPCYVWGFEEDETLTVCWVGHWEWQCE